MERRLNKREKRRTSVSYLSEHTTVYQSLGSIHDGSLGSQDFWQFSIDKVNTIHVKLPKQRFYNAMKVLNASNNNITKHISINTLMEWRTQVCVWGNGSTEASLVT
jgi:hypothetical protein